MTGEAPHKKTSPGLLKSLMTTSAQIEGSSDGEAQTAFKALLKTF